MLFADRADAGRRLAAELDVYAARRDVIVLGVPRGGVSVAFEVAAALEAPLDIFVSRKLGVPGQEELAFGAVSSAGVRHLDRDTIESLRISRGEIERITAEARVELDRRERLYRGSRPPLDVWGRTVLLVDDGIATGSSLLAAIQALREANPAHVVLAVPVGPASTCRRLRPHVDDLVCVHAPRLFHAIGQFYANFSQSTDEEVADLLERATHPVAAKAASA